MLRPLDQRFSSLINSNADRPKVLFSTINKVLNPIATTFPEVSPAVCNYFLEFFITKIQNICSNITNSGNVYFVDQCDLDTLTSFEPMSLSDLTEIICHMKRASCSLDRIPKLFLLWKYWTLLAHVSSP